MLDDDALLTLMNAASAMGRRFARSRQRLSLQEKAPGQFASEADHAIENAIRLRLAGLLGEVAVVGEEGGGSLDESTSGWALDPIDGTSNFLRGLPLWGISVGYLQHGQAVIGAIALPELHVTLTARRGAGLKLNGRAFHPGVPASAVRLFALGENDFEPGPATDARGQRLREEGYAVVRYGCAVFALASVALGRLDGYVEHGCRLWDIAAAWAICREAGVRIDIREIAPGRYSVDARRPLPLR